MFQRLEGHELVTHNGRVFAVPVTSPNIGADYGVDGDDDSLGWDDEVGADPARKRARQQRRMERQGLRRSQRDQKWEARWDRKLGDDDDQGGSMPMQDTAFGGIYTVSAAGAWSVTVTPSIDGTLEDLICEGPSASYVSNVSTGLQSAINGQQLAVSVFGPTAISRGLVKGLKVKAGIPITISGTTTATSGIVSASAVVRGPSPGCR